MFDLKSKHDVDIYVSTLFALARDAREQNQREAYWFITSYLHGLAPAEDVDAMSNVPWPAKAAPSPPPPEPPAPPPPPPRNQPRVLGEFTIGANNTVRRAPKQSSTLTW